MWEFVQILSFLKTKNLGKWQVLNRKRINLQGKKRWGSELGKLENLFKFCNFAKLFKIRKITSFKQKTNQFTRKKIRGSELGKWANLFKFCDFSEISKNQNRKRIKLQWTKFEVLNWENGRICSNSPIFENFAKSRKMPSFEHKTDQFTRRKIRGSELGKLENLFKFSDFLK